MKSQFKTIGLEEVVFELKKVETNLAFLRITEMMIILIILLLSNIR